MTMVSRLAVLVAVSAALAGCGSAARSMLERDDSAVQASASPNLTMPPDLRLPPPGSAPPPAASYNPPPTTGAAPGTAAAPRPAYGDDVYAQAGISTTNPDGSRKPEPQLREELRQYYAAKKREKNPNYGTVFNIGNIFSDD